eukprot:CAMPEP_0117654006 /NCGR_PEP_ID=MMETSP0804-20121206/3509_1 /TAXON_ID=1074897 /ORGANISM="Tetraselmis astigmatica, Strain CCMP880" /LENGTH=115 /DNA_ID=CAMNT_0005460249 /DNA_START=649 /DNA_END=994 /DNA_ORIENTATION=-
MEGRQPGRPSKCGGVGLSIKDVREHARWLHPLATMTMFRVQAYPLRALDVPDHQYHNARGQRAQHRSPARRRPAGDRHKAPPPVHALGRVPRLEDFPHSETDLKVLYRDGRGLGV